MERSPGCSQEAVLVIACREDADLNGFRFPYLRMNNPRLEISSRDIRRRIKEGRPCRYLMPTGVYEYIMNNNLYGDLHKW